MYYFEVQLLSLYLFLLKARLLRLLSVTQMKTFDVCDLCSENASTVLKLLRIKICRTSRSECLKWLPAGNRIHQLLDEFCMAAQVRLPLCQISFLLLVFAKKTKIAFPSGLPGDVKT